MASAGTGLGASALRLISQCFRKGGGWVRRCLWPPDSVPWVLWPPELHFPSPPLSPHLLRRRAISWVLFAPIGDGVLWSRAETWISGLNQGMPLADPKASGFEPLWGLFPNLNDVNNDRLWAVVMGKCKHNNSASYRSHCHFLSQTTHQLVHGSSSLAQDLADL